MAPWNHGTMVPGYHGTTVSWRGDTMVLRYDGAMVQWYYGTMVSCHLGTMVGAGRGGCSGMLGGYCRSNKRRCGVPVLGGYSGMFKRLASGAIDWHSLLCVRACVSPRVCVCVCRCERVCAFACAPPSAFTGACACAGVVAGACTCAGAYMRARVRGVVRVCWRTCARLIARKRLEKVCVGTGAPRRSSGSDFGPAPLRGAPEYVPVPPHLVLPKPCWAGNVSSTFSVPTTL